MYVGFGLVLFVICIVSSVQTNHVLHRHRSRIFRRHDESSSGDVSLLDLSILPTTTESPLFFQNEPVPLASSVVDDLTTLASAIYIITLIILIFILLAWFTHYNAPCSSIITSILSTITGLPEPIIRSVALCGACCVWCETTWLFRRIHQFNIWMSNRIKEFVSITCKILYDTICPCCRPPDTPSNRSIIGELQTALQLVSFISILSGSLPASILAMINMPDAPNPPSPKPIATVIEPTSKSPMSLPVKVDLHPPPTAELAIEKQDYSASKIKINTPQTTGKKRRKQPRKRTQSKQRSAANESSEIEEQTDEFSDDEYEDENAEVY